MFLSLTIICVVAGAILAGVNMYTTGCRHQSSSAGSSDQSGHSGIR